MLRRRFPLALLIVLTACRDGAPAAPAPEPEPAPTAPTAPPPARAAPELVAIDMFGTRQVTLEQVMAAHGDALRAYGGSPGQTYDELSIEAQLHELGEFAYIGLSLVGYYETEGMKYYLTIDFVDAADAARRMPFLPEPTGSYDDPAGLIATWQELEAKQHQLMESGQLSPNRAECPAYHCIGDLAHPELAPPAERVAALAPAHFNELAAILRDDAIAYDRATAAFLLAYTRDGPALVQQLLPAFRDSSSLVRNNAMRVIADIVFFHPELAVPVDPVLDALDYPSTLDRNKAAAILDGLLAQPGGAALRATIARRAGATLVAMLRLQQPNNHDFAHRILKEISGESFGDRDYAAWDAWLAAANY